MMSTFRASLVIARRDFTATVVSRTFVIFLLFPIVMLAFSFGFGSMMGRMAAKESRPTVAVVAAAQDADALSAARKALNPAFGLSELPDFLLVTPDGSGDSQARALLAAPDKHVIAVLTGGIDRPRLTGSVEDQDKLTHQVRALVAEARQQRALAAAHAAPAPVRLELVTVTQSAGALVLQRSGTARLGQMLLFLVTIMLSGALLSNLIEEKSNKVVEVLAAAVPIDAVFFGKLLAMLAVSLVGIVFWAAGGFAASQIWPTSDVLAAPAVGWPLFVILGLLYYAANYLLLGALFLGIGSQAATVREVQTLSMPVTVGQLFVFMLASAAAGPFNSPLGIGAALFPFSSPLTMLARAAQTGALWPHLLALAWQALWVWIILQLGAAFFRRNVLKSGGTPAAAFGPRRKRA